MNRPLSRRPGLLAWLALLLCGGALAQQGAAPLAPEAQARAQRYYAQVCARCHETGIGPVITGRNLPPVIYTTIVRSGVNAMPAFRLSDIDDARLQELAQFLSATPAQGAPR